MKNLENQTFQEIMIIIIIKKQLHGKKMVHENEIVDDEKKNITKRIIKKWSMRVESMKVKFPKNQGI